MNLFTSDDEWLQEVIGAWQKIWPGHMPSQGAQMAMMEIFHCCKNSDLVWRVTEKNNHLRVLQDSREAGTKASGHSEQGTFRPDFSQTEVTPVEVRTFRGRAQWQDEAPPPGETDQTSLTGPESALLGIAMRADKWSDHHQLLEDQEKMGWSPHCGGMRWASRRTST